MKSTLLFLAIALATFGAGQAQEANSIAVFGPPFQATKAALAPDGRHVAYTWRQTNGLFIAVIFVDYPDDKVLVPVAPAEEPGAVVGARPPPPFLDVTSLRWVSADRLVIATNDYRVFAVNADGSGFCLLADQVSLGFRPEVGPISERARLPLIARIPRLVAFPPDDSRHVVIAAMGGPETTFFKVDVMSGQREEIGAAKPGEFIVDQAGRPEIFSPGSAMFGLQKLSYAASGPADPKAEDLNQYLGGNFATFQASPEVFFGRRSIPLGFGKDPDVLYFASNADRDTYGVYAVNLRTKKRLNFAVEDPRFDLAGPADFCSTAPLVFDDYSRQLVGVRWTGLEPGVRWLDPQLQRVQEKLDADFTHRSVRIAGWDRTRSRYLLLVADEADPGRYYLYEPATDRLMFLVRRVPWLKAEEFNLTESFSFVSPAGVPLTGYITMPRHPRVSPPALVVICHSGPGGRDGPAFDPEVQMLAGMGFAVLQVNYRGSFGFGERFFDAGRENFADYPAEDVAAAIDWIVSREKINPKRVAVMGRGFGGYVALRLMQLQPGRFRSGIVIDPITDLDRLVHDSLRRLRARAARVDEQRTEQANLATGLLGGAVLTPQDQSANPEADQSHHFMGPVFDQLRDNNKALRAIREIQLPKTTFDAAYFGDDRGQLRSVSPALHPEAIRQPIFIIQNVESADSQATELRDALAKQSSPRAYFGINRTFDAGVPQARVVVFSRIGEFLNLTLYDFHVKLGTVKIIQ